MVAAANAVAACPDGNEEPCGSLTAAWIAWSAMGGRARPTADLITVVSGHASSPARAAYANVQGSARRRRSASPPSAGMNRLFTHQAEARIMSQVSGWKRIAWSASLTASSTGVTRKTPTTCYGCRCDLKNATIRPGAQDG